MNRGNEEESLYDWYTNPILRKTCPKCSSQNVKDVTYGQDKDGFGIIYRCQKCFYQYGVEDESSQAYFDKNSNPTIYWK
jgi:transposase-like protein